MNDTPSPPAPDVADALQEVRDRISESVVGLEDATDDLLTAFMTRGHVLLEGVPGIAKTTLAKAFSYALGLDFNRIQFTQDLLPADVTGHYYFDQADNEFKFRKGPLFANVILADEINRASAKTQSALLEAMQEGQVTVEGDTYPLPTPFFVVATQNPVDVEGVFELPVAQLDRFMLKTRISYLGRDRERRVLERDLEGTLPDEPPREPDQRLADAVLGAHEAVHADATLVDYVLDIVDRTREHEDLTLGGSTRAGLHLLRAARGRALLDGRDYVIPDDVQRVAPQVLAHRLSLSVDAELEDRAALDILDEIVAETSVPHVEHEAPP